MARPDPQASICEHVAAAQPGGQPFTIEQVFDEAGGGITDAVLTCRICSQVYLVEMLEWEGERLERRRYRVSSIPPQVAQTYLRNSRRPTCDLSRATAEADALKVQSHLTRLVATLEVPMLTVTATEQVQLEFDIPMTSWRDRLR